MTDSKHTPKPWLTSGRAIYALNDQGENRFTASIEGGWVHRGRFSSERTSHEELLAVRNLIAAAPDLLEALKEARATVASMTIHDMTKGDVPMHPKMLAMIDAALSKAEGRS